MKRFFLIAILLVSLIFLGALFLKKQEMAYQADADIIRIEHLIYWSGLIEDYKTKTGHYPLQDQVGNGHPILVKIATKEQQTYLIKGGKNYEPRFDNNATGFFQEFSVKALVDKLEDKLGHQIDEKYDIQRVPVKNTVGYYYFTEKDGYLLWVTCITCGVTPVSTLLMDGITPTVNIVSEGMKGKVTKALTRSEMFAHPIFKEWQKQKFSEEGYARHIEQLNINDSKKVK